MAAVIERHEWIGGSVYLGKSKSRRTIGRCVAHSTGISGEVLVGHESVRIHCLGSRAADGQLDSDGGPDTLA